MRLRRNKKGNGVSSAWISIADLYSHLMMITLVLALYFMIDEPDTELKYAVSGRVLGLTPAELNSAAFMEGDLSSKVRRDGGFELTELDEGQHLYDLLVPDRAPKKVYFEIKKGAFHGLDVVMDPKAAQGSRMAIKPLTEEALGCRSADYRLGEKGKVQISEQIREPTSNSDGPLLTRLQNDPSLRIAVIGQADRRVLRDRPYTNRGLSSLRAAAVGDHLNKLGVSQNQIVVMGLGATWLPSRLPSEIESDYNARCRRIVIMYMENSQEELLEKVRMIQ